MIKKQGGQALDSLSWKALEKQRYILYQGRKSWNIWNRLHIKSGGGLCEE